MKRTDKESAKSQFSLFFDKKFSVLRQKNHNNNLKKFSQAPLIIWVPLRDFKKIS